jgi:hypothetical protein
MLCAGERQETDDVIRPGEGVFFLYLDDVESLLVYLGSKGYSDRLEGLYPLQPGRDFFLRDPDGYVLWFSHRPVNGDAAAGGTAKSVAGIASGQVAGTVAA